MRSILVALLLASLSIDAIAQPADCPQEPTNAPLGPPGVACRTTAPPPLDVLRGEPGDLLRGPGRPHVTVEAR